MNAIKNFKHFIACKDCNIVMNIKIGSYQFCYKCKRHNIIIFTLSGTKEELNKINDMKYSDLEKYLNFLDFKI